MLGVLANKIIVMKKRISLVDNDKIRNHLANNSPAKIVHSFSKSKRFLDPNPEYLLHHPDVRQSHMTLNIPPLEKGIVESASGNGLTSQRIELCHQGHPPTS